MKRKEYSPIFEADSFKDFKEEEGKYGKYAEIETGLEKETTAASINYDIPNDILEEIIDKLKSDPKNTLNLDKISKESIAKRIIYALIDKFLSPDNITAEDILTTKKITKKTDLMGQKPELEDDDDDIKGVKESFSVLSFSEFIKENYRE